jgi:hypothetical protein
VVHSGRFTRGHYHSFIKPNPDTPWLKFDDERVTPALDHEVFEENFGDGNPTRPTSAYALIYIRTSMMDQILAPVTESDIPPALSTFMSSSLYFRSALTRLSRTSDRRRAALGTNHRRATLARYTFDCQGLFRTSRPGSSLERFFR